MAIQRTGDPTVDRGLDAVEADRRRAGSSLLAQGVLGTSAVYSRGAVVLRPGQSVLVWQGRTASAVTLPPAAGLGSGNAAWLAVHNEGSANVTLRANARETIADGFVASTSLAVRPGQTLLLVSNGAARWCTAPASVLAWGVDSVAATAALTRFQQVVTWTGAAGTLTLPAANVDGTAAHFVYIFNDGTGALTVQRAGSDTIADGLNDVTSITLVPHSAALLWSDGISAWAGSLPAAPIGSAPQDYMRGQSATSWAETWYYANAANCTALAGAALTIGNMYAMPFIAPKRTATLDRIAVRTTAGVGGSNIRLGLYANAGTAENPYPGSLIRDSGNISSAGAAVLADSLSQALTAGALYWMVVHPSAAISIVCFAVAGASPFLGTDNTLSLTPTAGLFVNQAFGALPSTYPGAPTRITAAPIPAIGLRFAT